MFFFFLRILLHDKKGPTSFESLKLMVKSCLKLGLLENDQQWEAKLAESSISRTPKTLRGLSAIILKVCEVNNPVEIWNKFKNDLAEDFKHPAQLRNPE